MNEPQESEVGSDEADLQACEACGAEHPLEEMHMMEDCWYCTKCSDDWKAQFDACAHSWEPHISTMGDEGFYCTRCAGFVATEDFPSLGLAAPQSAPLP